MDEKSTQVQNDEKLAKTDVPAKKGISSQTISFLKMFARCYHAESSPSVALNGTSVN